MSRRKEYENGTARVKARRERLNLVAFTVELPRDVFEAFEVYRAIRNSDRIGNTKDESRSDLIVRLIKNDILRKR